MQFNLIRIFFTAQFTASNHQVTLWFQPVKSKRILETCVIVIGVIYEFLLVWPFIVRKKGQGH
jgi:hypothetical protein